MKNSAGGIIAILFIALAISVTINFIQMSDYENLHDAWVASSDPIFKVQGVEHWPRRPDLLLSLVEGRSLDHQEAHDRGPRRLTPLRFED